MKAESHEERAARALKLLGTVEFAELFRRFSAKARPGRNVALSRISAVIDAMPHASSVPVLHQTLSLLCAAKEGDSLSWDILCDRYRDYLKFMVSMCLPRSNECGFEAESVVRGVFDIAWTGLRAAIDGEDCDRYLNYLEVVARMRLASCIHFGADAEDIGQGTFVRAWTNLGSFEYRGEASFLGWLTAIMHTLVYDRNRVRQGPAWSGKNPVECVTASSAVQSKHCIGDELRSEFGWLPRRDQMIIGLRIALNMKWKSIAGILGSSRESTCRRFFRSLENLGSFHPNRSIIGTEALVQEGEADDWRALSGLGLLWRSDFRHRRELNYSFDCRTSAESAGEAKARLRDQFSSEWVIAIENAIGPYSCIVDPDDDTSSTASSTA